MERVNLMGSVEFEYHCNHCGHNNTVRHSVESFNQMTELDTNSGCNEFFVNTTCVNCHEHVEVSFSF